MRKRRPDINQIAKHGVDEATSVRPKTDATAGARRQALRDRTRESKGTRLDMPLDGDLRQQLDDLVSDLLKGDRDAD